MSIDYTEVVADLERRAREFNQAAQQCTEAAATIRGLAGVPQLGPMGPAAPTAALPPATRPRVRAERLAARALPAKGGTAPAPSPPADGAAWENDPQKLKTAIKVLDHAEQQLRDDDGLRPFAQQVLEVIRSHGPDDVRVMTVNGALKAKKERVRRAIDDLVARGLVTRTGKTAGTRVSIAAAPTAPGRASTDVVDDAAADSRLAFVILRDVLSARLWLTAGEVAERVREHGVSPTRAAVERVLANMVREGACELGAVGSQPAYLLLRKPSAPAAPPAAAPIALPDAPPLNAQEARSALQRVFESGASYDLAELVRNVRQTVPAIDTAALQPILQRLEEQRLVRRIPLGSTTRWQKVAAPR